MESQIESNNRLTINNITGVALENMLPNKDDRLVKRSKVLPNLVSCDLISDNQSLLSSRTLSGDSQCLENYPYLSLIDHRKIPHSVVDGDNKVIDSVCSSYENNVDREIIYGYKNNFYDSDVNSVKGVDSKLKQSNERRAGRPPLDRSDYFCQICSATKTPQWRYISVCSVESKLRVCNACWMKQRKKRDGKCLPLQIGMSNINCLGVGNVLKSSKVGINKENFDPQRQNYSGIINNINYKMNITTGKGVLSVNNNFTGMGNGVCGNGGAQVCEGGARYIDDCSLGGGMISYSNGNFSNSTSFMKNVSFRSSPYSFDSKITHQNDSTLNCSCDLTKGCFCQNIEQNNISLSIGNNNVQDLDFGLDISNEKSYGVYCQRKDNENIHAENISLDNHNINSKNVLHNGCNSKGSLLDYSTQDINHIYTVGDKNADQLDIIVSADDQLKVIGNLTANERIMYKIESSIIEGSERSKLNEPITCGVGSTCTNQSPEMSPDKDNSKSPNKNQNVNCSNRIGKIANNSVGTRYNTDNNRNYVVSCGKLSISTPVHHQNSTTVSPNTNYCNVSSYASSPCQSFTAFDGPFIEDPNKTMCASIGNSFFYSNTDAGRWNEDSTIQAQMVVLNSSGTEENNEKVETLPFSLGREISESLSRNNEHIEQDQTGYSIFNKQMDLPESWSGECLPVDMFCIPSEKATLNSEASTTSDPHFTIGQKEFSGSSVCTIPLGYSTEVPQDNEHSSQNDCATWDFDPSSISCIETWQNPLWYDSFSSSFCKLS
ncbi:GATA type DNA binding domain fused to an AT hook [Cryptosporidium xiaoi]|uniref:GATA type DNA binding domain fused to an AT hook n=1 Tax=Cryptosporidium xiaoi TaxID=659607 RepID=A0AAV9XSB8_9CRYT